MSVQKLAAERPLVVVVDDDPQICEAAKDLLRSVDIETLTFSNARDMLNYALPDKVACMVLDVRLPGISGLDFQAQLNARGNALPIIFMTGHGDIPMTVRAMKAGAMDFLAKPVRDQDLLDAVFGAIDRDTARRANEAEARQIAELEKTLTPREREVASSVIRGLMNKQIAYDLGITEMTVKLHRGNVMRKMQARSVADLIYKAQMLGGIGQ